MKKWRETAYKLLLLTYQGFSKSQIQQGASSLTYYILLGIVPILAFLIGIARGFDLDGALQEWALNQFPEQKIILDKIFEFANTSAKTTSQGLIAGVSIALLLWAGIKIFLNLEQVMNEIWEVRDKRSIARRFINYLAILFLFPLIIVLTSGLSGYISAFITQNNLLQHISFIIIPLINLIPFLLLCAVFIFLYIAMPNTPVRFIPALSAGIFTGIVYQTVQWIYLYFQIGVTKYNAIYGTFAALPLFLVWVHLSWVIVLLGAKIAFAIQNVDAFDFVSDNVHLSYRARTLLFLRITHHSIKQFTQGQTAPTAIELSNALALPLPLVRESLYKLVNGEILSEIQGVKKKESGFQPARSVDQLTIKYILDKLYTKGVEVPLPETAEIKLILSSLEKFGQAIESSDGNILLKNV